MTLEWRENDSEGSVAERSRRQPEPQQAARPRRVAAMCGSFRSGSYNRALLLEAQRRAALSGLEIIEVDIYDFPFYTQDWEVVPDDVALAKALIQTCECILLVTPEYNYGVPGYLKNAVDCLSRPTMDETLFGRPMALMGASQGHGGTLRAQLAWRQSWHYFRAPVFSEVEVTVPYAARNFDDHGRLVNEELSARLETYLLALKVWLDELACE